MSKHLPAERLMDVLDGVAPGETLDHVGSCPRCQARVEQARGGLLLGREAEVPEPSPLYWEVFRRQVGQQIERAATVSWRWRPALAAAALIVALASLLPRPGPSSGPGMPTVLPAWAALPPSNEDLGLAVLEAMRPAFEDLSLAAGCHVVAECLAGLSEEESLALADALRQEMAEREL